MSKESRVINSLNRREAQENSIGGAFVLPNHSGRHDHATYSFSDGSVLFSLDNRLSEDNSNLFYSSSVLTVPALSVAGNYSLPTTDGSSDQVLTTDGSGNVTWEDGVPGATGPTGPTGPAGADGSPGNLWTDGGTITYLDSTTDDLAVGGTDTSASVYVDVSQDFMGVGGVAPTATLHANSANKTTANLIENNQPNGTPQLFLNSNTSLADRDSFLTFQKNGTDEFSMGYDTGRDSFLMNFGSTLNYLNSPIEIESDNTLHIDTIHEDLTIEWQSTTAGSAILTLHETSGASDKDVAILMTSNSVDEFVMGFDNGNNKWCVNTGSTLNASTAPITVDSSNNLAINDLDDRLTISYQSSGPGEQTFTLNQKATASDKDTSLLFQNNSTDKFIMGYDNSTTKFTIKPADNKSLTFGTAGIDLDSSGVTTVQELIIASPSVPASASASGTAGEIAYDSSYIYICVSTNTWKRVAISTW